jgi:alpha-L-fucosidase
MRRRAFLKLASLAGSGIAAGKLLGEFPLSAQGAATVPPLPAPAPMPELPPKQPPGSVPMGDPTGFPEARMDFPIVPGPYAPTWESIARNYPGKEVGWLRDAKFGIWVHFGPQAAGMSGDWYARRLYMQGQTAYNNHVRDFGHPSEVGYKDLLKDWNPAKLDPAGVVKLYKEIGARFMLIQGVHHDNFDNWNSAYQPWNSRNIGPKRDLLGEWSQAAHKAGMRFGVSFHHEYTWWWWLKSLGSDQTGPKAGVPYDGNQTPTDGKGKWWEGLDPRLLYGVDLREYKGFDQDSNCPYRGILTNHQEYCKWYVTRWALRIMDVVRKYDPDFIYTDGNSTQPYTGYLSGTGYKCDAMQRVMADFYNHSLVTRGKVDTFSIVKHHPPGNGVVNTFENNWPADIKTDQPWIGETACGDWYYAPGFVYDAGALVRHMLEIVSRDGSFCINIAMRPDGSLDDGSLKMLAEVGDWMKVNGEAIYGSRAWVKLGEGADGRPRMSPIGKISGHQADFKFGPQDFRFTAGKDGSVYAFCLTVPDPGTALKITSMGTEAQPGAAAVKSVRLLGSTAPLDWKQQADGLQIKCPAQMPFHIALVFKVILAAA